MICKASRCLLLNCCPAACGDMCLNLQDFQDAVESSTVDIYIYTPNAINKRTLLNFSFISLVSVVQALQTKPDNEQVLEFVKQVWLY